MSSATARARGIPKKTKEISPLGVSSTEAGTSSTDRRRSSTDRRPGCGVSAPTRRRRPRASRGRPRRRTRRRTGLGATQCLEPRGRGVTPSCARSIVRHRSTRSTTAREIAADLDLAADPTFLLERLGRLDDQVGAQPAPVGVDAELPAHHSRVAVPTSETGSRVEVRDVPPSGAPAPDRRTARQLLVELPRRRPAMDVVADDLTVPSDAVLAPYRNTSSRRRNRRLSLPAANRPSLSTTAYAGRRRVRGVDVDAVQRLPGHRLHGVAADLEDWWRARGPG